MEKNSSTSSFEERSVIPPTKNPPAATMFIRRLPHGAIWALALFLLLEAAARCLWTPGVVGKRTYCRYAPSYHYGYDEHVPLFEPKGSKWACYPVLYRETHEQYLPRHKGTNEFRIFAFGGSVTYGISYRRSYPWLLQYALATARPDTDWRVVNLSVRGYGSRRLLLLLKQAVEFQPDLLVIHLHGSNEYEDERDLAYRNAVNAGYHGVLFSSHLVVLLKQGFDRFFQPPNQVAVTMEDEQAADKKPENLARWNTEMRANLIQMLRLAREYQVPVILVGRAERDRSPEGQDSARLLSVNELTRRFAEGPDILYFDTTRILDRNFTRPDQRRKAFRDEIHLSDAGLKTVANELANCILSNVVTKAKAPEPSR